jgi:hypothetical protein
MALRPQIPVPLELLLLFAFPPPSSPPRDRRRQRHSLSSVFVELPNSSHLHEPSRAANVDVYIPAPAPRLLTQAFRHKGSFTISHLQHTMAYQMAPATPQRPGPGAFINTPAPNRPNFQRQSSLSQPQPQSQSQPQQQQQALPAPPTESPIERAARTINNMLDRDCRYPSLEGYIGRESRGHKLHLVHSC